MTNWYAEAIGILAGINADESYNDAVQLATEIAKKNPKALVDAWRRLHPEPERPPRQSEDLYADLKNQCRSILNSVKSNGEPMAGRVVEAVKHWRHVTGASLKDAKEEIDKLR